MGTTVIKIGYNIPKEEIGRFHGYAGVFIIQNTEVESVWMKKMIHELKTIDDVKKLARSREQAHGEDYYKMENFLKKKLHRARDYEYHFKGPHYVYVYLFETDERGKLGFTKVYFEYKYVRLKGMSELLWR